MTNKYILTIKNEKGYIIYHPRSKKSIILQLQFLLLNLKNERKAWVIAHISVKECESCNDV